MNKPIVVLCKNHRDFIDFVKENPELVGNRRGNSYENLIEINNNLNIARIYDLEIKDFIKYGEWYTIPKVNSIIEVIQSRIR